MDSLIFDIQRFCVHDGPGIRTTVFFKGCNMRCKWCHNPESFSLKSEILFYKDKCVQCGLCLECPVGAHVFSERGHEILREKCTGCGLCAENCLDGALQLTGKKMTADEVMKVIQKDEKFYETSLGGVTFSGGEASMHTELLTELLVRCREKGYHTALETNGQMGEEKLRRLIPLVDLFLLDVKHTDEEKHFLWTGAPLAPVIKTLSILNECGANVIMRCVIVPGVNDNEAHFDSLRKLIQENCCIQDAEIMAYHDIGKGKWEALGLSYPLDDTKTASNDDRKKWEKMLKG